VWLVLAHRWDSAAHALAQGWPQATRLVMPADLSAAGWSLRLAGRDDGWTWPSPDPFDGVLTRLTAISAADLPQVHAADRVYAAAELGAFLLAWLDACPAPVLNRPAPGCLNGPPWSAEQWALAAYRAGLAPAPLRRSTRPPDRHAPATAPRHGAARHGAADRGGPGGGGPSRGGPGPDEVAATVVGQRVIGPVHPRVAESAVRLAAVAGTPLLGLTFDGCGERARFLTATAWTDLDGAAALAVARHLGWTTC